MKYKRYRTNPPFLKALDLETTHRGLGSVFFTLREYLENILRTETLYFDEEAQVRDALRHVEAFLENEEE